MLKATFSMCRYLKAVGLMISLSKAYGAAVMWGVLETFELVSLLAGAEQTYKWIFLIFIKFEFPNSWVWVSLIFGKPLLKKMYNFFILPLGFPITCLRCCLLLFHVVLRNWCVQVWLFSLRVQSRFELLGVWTRLGSK